MKRLQNHKAYWAFLIHRLSGLMLALFLPFHFYVLGLALESPDPLDKFLKISEIPMVKIAEWGLISLLSLHFCFGTRLLILEFFTWSNHRQAKLGWIFGGISLTGIIGLIFLLRVF